MTPLHRRVMVHAPEMTAEAIAAAVADATDALEAPVSVWAMFRFHLPPYDRLRLRHVHRPRLSGLVRMVEDAIGSTAGVWEITARKVYVARTEPPGVSLVITSRAPEEYAWREAEKSAAKSKASAGRHNA